MADEKKYAVTFLDLLGLLFIGLKLGGVIDWNWWWVTCPLWGGVAIVLAVVVIVAICKAIAEIFG